MNRKITEEIHRQIMAMISNDYDEARTLSFTEPHLKFESVVKFLESEYPDKTINDNEFNEWLGYVGNPFRCELFAYLATNFTGYSEKAFANGLRYAYTTGYIQSLSTFFMFSSFFDSVDRNLLMEVEELETIKNLPDEVVIYRGGSNQEMKNGMIVYSWTLDESIAEFFAFRHTTKNRCVYKTTICKEEILAYFDCRYEKEIIVEVGDADSVEIVTTEPTQLYFDYMESKQNK